jgi:hypothetical protein
MIPSENEIVNELLKRFREDRRVKCPICGKNYFGSKEYPGCNHFLEDVWRIFLGEAKLVRFRLMMQHAIEHQNEFDI